MRKIAASLAAAILLSACADTHPTNVMQRDLDKTDSRHSATAAILNAALKAYPGLQSDLVSVGVLDEGRTEENATVVYLSQSHSTKYRFERVNGDWMLTSRVEQVSPGDRVTSDVATTEEASFNTTGDRSVVVARLYDNSNTVKETWNLPSTVRQSGDYMKGPSTASGVSRGVFYTSETMISDTAFRVDELRRWEFTNSAGGPFISTLSESLFGSGASNIKLFYHVTVAPPVFAAITGGPSNITCGGAYQWTGSPSGGAPGAGFTFQWAYSTDNVNWTPGGTGLTYSRPVTSGGSFWLKFTATNSGRSASAVRHVTVANPIDTCLEVTLDGPNHVDQSGTYTWEAEPWGGTGSYTYQWQVYWYNQGRWDTLGTGRTQSLYIDGAHGEFMVRVVVSSGYQSVDLSRGVTNAISCPPGEEFC